MQEKTSNNKHNSWNLVFYERPLGVKDLVLFISDQDTEHNKDGKNQVT